MKQKRKNEKQKLMQIERPLPTERDDEIELIDLSSLTDINPEEEADLSSLNHRISPRHPKKWWINESGGSCKEYSDGSIEFAGGPGDYHELYSKCEAELKYDICSARRPPYRTITGENVRPTQIISLLSQNPDTGSRPANTYPWSDQADEGHYIAKANKGLPEIIAATQDNYYFVEENSEHRLKFRCPEMGKGDDGHTWLDGDGEDEAEEYDSDDYNGSWRDRPPLDIGDILIHVNPDNDQAVWHCPRCSLAQGKKVVHTIPRGLRDALAKDGIIPAKAYKYRDRVAEAPRLLELVAKNPGMSFYELDQLMGWGTDGKTSERILNKQLKDKVELRKGRKGHKGYKVYIKH